MRVQYKKHIGRQLQNEHVSGTDLVNIALCNAGIGYDGAIESMQAEIRCLTEIVGKLVDKVPEQDRIEVCGLEYELERIK